MMVQMPDKLLSAETLGFIDHRVPFEVPGGARGTYRAALQQYVVRAQIELHISFVYCHLTEQWFHWVTNCRQWAGELQIEAYLLSRGHTVVRCDVNEFELLTTEGGVALAAWRLTNPKP